MVDSKENYKFDQGIKGLTLKIWLLINYKNLVLDQDNNFYLISLSILSLFAKWCIMDMIGRSYMLINSGS